MRAVLLNRILIGLGLLGVFIAGSLSLAKFQHKVLPCGLAGSCQAVSEHPSAYWFGIPVAYFGLLGYVALTLLAVGREVTAGETKRGLVLPGYLFSIFGFFASAFLQYISFMVIGEKCTWCIASALTMLATLAVYTMLYATADGTAAAGARPRTRSWPAVVGLLLLTVGVTVGYPAVYAARTAIQAVKVPEGTQLIPTPRNELGPADAPVTIVEFADFCCPTCRLTAAPTRALVEKYPGKIRLVFRHFPLFNKDGHEMAFPAAVASEFAADKGKFWQFQEKVMSTPQPPTTTAEVLAIAGSIGLDKASIGKLLLDDKSPEWQRVYRDFQAGNEIGVAGTPSFYVVAGDRAPVKVSFEALGTLFDNGEYSRYVK